MLNKPPFTYVIVKAEPVSQQSKQRQQRQQKLKKVINEKVPCYRVWPSADLARDRGSAALVYGSAALVYGSAALVYGSAVLVYGSAALVENAQAYGDCPVQDNYQCARH